MQSSVPHGEVVMGANELSRLCMPQGSLSDWALLCTDCLPACSGAVRYHENVLAADMSGSMSALFGGGTLFQSRPTSNTCSQRCLPGLSMGH